MRKIPLTQGLYAIVDDIDYSAIASIKWHVQKNRNTFYAIRNIVLPRKDNKRFITTVRMHREILELSSSQDSCVDHINGNGLDNRRCNLRIVTVRENSISRHHKKSSIYSGVCWHKQRSKWLSSIYFKGRSRHIGLFENEIDAATAYRVAYAILTRGET